MSGDIYTALSKCMAEIGVIGKTRKNAQQGYSFRGIDDVMAHCVCVLSAHGVVCIPRVLEREREMVATKSGGQMASVRLLVAHDFFATDGSHVCCVTLGEAMDAGDKASNKAMSAALKYALTETLMIPTYEAERDTEDASPQMVSTATAIKSGAVDYAQNGAPVSERAKLEVSTAEAQDEAALSALVPRITKLAPADQARLRLAWGARRDELRKSAGAGVSP